MTEATSKDEMVEQLLAKLENGEGLASICRAPAMPCRATVYNWMQRDAELGARITEAREAGYLHLAEKTLQDVENCEDPIKARLLFDARRWYLGKLSIAFAEKPVAIGAFVNVDAGDAFAAVAGALDRAAAGIASRGTSTRAVVIECETGSGDPAGRLADLDGAGGPRLGEDANGG